MTTPKETRSGCASQKTSSHSSKLELEALLRQTLLTIRRDSKRPQETHYCRKCDLTSTSSIALVPIPPKLRQLAVACLRFEILNNTEEIRRARIKELVTHVEHSSLFLELDCKFSEMLDLSEKAKAKSVAVKTAFYVLDDYERCQEMGIVP